MIFFQKNYVYLRIYPWIWISGDVFHQHICQFQLTTKKDELIINFHGLKHCLLPIKKKEMLKKVVKFTVCSIITYEGEQAGANYV